MTAMRQHELLNVQTVEWNSKYVQCVALPTHIDTSLTTITELQLLSCLQYITGPVLLDFTYSSSSVPTRRVGENGTNSRGPAPEYIANIFVFLGIIIIC